MKLKDISEEALKVLAQHNWPGNIRELRNQIERLMIMIPKTIIEVSDVIPFMPDGRELANNRIHQMEVFDSLKDARNAFERDYINHRLSENEWNVSKTADDLKIERSHLHRKIKLLNLSLIHI